MLFSCLLQWTPLGFTLRDPNSLDDFSKERFEGTVLRAISKHPRKEIKKELEEAQRGGTARDGQVLFRQVKKNKINKANKTSWKLSSSVCNKHLISIYLQVKIKVEKTEEDEKQVAEAKYNKDGEQEENLDMKKEKQHEEEVKKNECPAAASAEMGRLVMTIDGQQKQLSFGPKDLLTTATMLDGDKVRGGFQLTVRLNMKLITKWIIP